MYKKRKRKKEPLFSPPICICYIFEFKYFNYLYKNKNKKIKKLITSRKNYSFLSQNFVLKKKKKFFKTFKNFCYPNLYNYHISLSSTLTYIIFFFFFSNLKFFYLSQFLSQSINSNVQLVSISYGFSISFLNIISRYLISF